MPRFQIVVIGRDGFEPSGFGTFRTYEEAAREAQDGIERGVAEVWEIEDYEYADGEEPLPF